MDIVACQMSAGVIKDKRDFQGIKIARFWMNFKADLFLGWQIGFCNKFGNVNARKDTLGHFAASQKNWFKESLEDKEKIRIFDSVFLGKFLKKVSRQLWGLIRE